MDPDARAHIELMLIDMQRQPEFLRHEKILDVAHNASWYKPGGGGGGYPFPHIIIGCILPEGVGAHHVELELVGFRVRLHPRTLEYLNGKRIELTESDKHKYLSMIDDTAPKWLPDGFVAGGRL
jgi:hypothetical protein